MKKLSLFIYSTICCFNLTYGQLTVTPYNGTALQTFVQNNLVGTGITISNVTFVGANRQMGSFNSANTTLTLQAVSNGVIMSTGSATTAIGPNTEAYACGVSGYIGNTVDDADLHSIAGASIKDKAILEFDFVPTGSLIEFSYIFGSEEYPEFVYRGYNDAFGFFLSGPGISGSYSNSSINLATIPSATTPITIDNVHDSKPSGGSFTADCANCIYYVNNGDPDGANTIAPYKTNNKYIQYDGYTTNLKAQAQVQCGQTYHLKIAIGDAGDQSYDSGVFLKGGSLSSVAINIPTTTISCSTNTVQLTASTNAINPTYTWSGPSIISGSNTATPIVGQPGIYTASITSNGCVSTKTTQVFSASTTTSSVTKTDATCTTSGSATVSPTGGATPYTYTWSPSGGNSSTASGLSANNYTIGITDLNGCISYTNVTITKTGSISATATNDNTLTCTTLTVALIGGPAAGVTYQWSGPALSGATTSQTATAIAAGSYTLLVTTVNGCTNTAITTVSQNTTTPTTTASTSGSVTCLTNTVSLTSTISGLSYTWTAPAGSSISGSSNLQNAIGQGVGTYTLNVLNPANGCTYTTSIAAVENTTTPTTTASTSGSVTCLTNTVSLTSAVSGLNYTWTAPAGSSISGSTNLQNATGQGAGIYTLNVLNPVNNCTYTTSIAAVENTVTPTSVSAGNDQILICGVSTVTLTGTATPTSAVANWLGGVVSPTNFTTTVGAANVYTLQAINPINGCFITSTVQVTSSVGAPTASIIPLTNSITCTNTMVTIGINPTSAGPFTYEWPSTGISGAIDAATATATLPGVYSVTLTNNPGNGCSIQLSITVPINTTAVTPSITPASTITCNTTSLTLNVNPVGAYTYSWTGTSPILFGDNTQNPTIDNGGTYSVSVTNTVSGCIGDAQISVASNTAVPTVTLGTASSVTTTCSSPNATLSATSNTDPNTLYTWTTPSSTTLSGSVIAVSDLGTYSVVITNTINGCSTSATAPATVNVVADIGVPTITLSSNSLSITCSNPTPSVSITTTASPVSYSWAPTIGILAGTETSATPVFTAAGSYSTIVTNTITGCATSMGGNIVDVILNNSTPIISLSSTTNDGTLTCLNLSVTVNPTITPSSSDLTYTWSPSIGISTPINQANATFTATGIYTLAITNTLTGCVSTSTSSASSFSVTADNTAPTATINAISSNSIIGCGANNGTVTLGSLVNATNTTFAAWLPGSINSPTLNVTSAGDYTLVVMDAVNGCTVASIYTVGGSTLAPQGVDAGSLANIACGDSEVALNGSSTSTNVSYSWTGPSATSLTGTNTANPIANEIGTYTLTVTDNVTGCQSSATVTVTQAIATASITANPTTGLSPLDVSFNASGVGNPSFVWDFANGNSSNSQNPNNTFLTGTYIVTLTATSGSCVATSTVMIVVEDGFTLEIPNVFTPNNDGSNDIFTIKSSGVKELSLQIFNRWGQKLYEFSGAKASWDGKVPSGNSAPEGTYFFFVKATSVDGKVIEKNGTVTLFR